MGRCVGTNCQIAASQPLAGSGTVTFDEFNVQTGVNSHTGDAEYGSVWYVESGPVSGEIGTVTLALPTVRETSTTEQAGTSGVISAGGAISLAANTLSNRGGQIGAAGNVTLNLQALNNGAVAATTTLQAVDTVDQSQLTSFLSTVNSLGYVGINNTSDFSVGWVPVAPARYYFNVSAAAPSETSTVAWSTPTGLIVAGNDMNVYGGSLVNAGTLFAQHNVNVYAQNAECVNEFATPRWLN